MITLFVLQWSWYFSSFTLIIKLMWLTFPRKFCYIDFFIPLDCKYYYHWMYCSIEAILVLENVHSVINQCDSTRKWIWRGRKIFIVLLNLIVCHYIVHWSYRGTSRNFQSINQSFRINKPEIVQNVVFINKTAPWHSQK